MTSEILRNPLGLILPGGGALGSWQLGVLLQLVEKYQLEFSGVVAYSAGALTAAGYCLDRMEECQHRWLSAEEAKILRFGPRMKSLSLCSNQALFDLVSYTEDEDRCKTTLRCPMTIVSVCRKAKEPNYHLFQPDGGHWDGPLRNVLVGSCSIPGVFPPVPNDYRGQLKYLVDGGVDVGQQLQLPGLEHCKDIIMIHNQIPDSQGQNWRLTLSRTTMGRGVFDQFITQALHSGQHIWQIHPSQQLNFGALQFKRHLMEPAIELGRGDADIFVDSLA